MVVTNIEELVPRVQMLAWMLIKRLKSENIDFKVAETYRSDYRQKELYAQGYTKVKTRGAHGFRVALDIYPATNGSANVNASYNEFKRISEVAKQLGFEWGGDWSTLIDLPHYQYLGGYSLAEYRAGYFPRWYNETLDEANEWRKGNVNMTEKETRACVKEEITKYVLSLSQLPPSSWALEALDYAKEHNVMIGNQVGNLEPQAFLTREQMAQILYNMSREAENGDS